jgi:hypothetical protein
MVNESGDKQGPDWQLLIKAGPISEDYGFDGYSKWVMIGYMLLLVHQGRVGRVDSA